MAWGNIAALVDGTRIAGADLSALQYHFVKLDASSEIIVCAADTDKPHGVLQNNPAAGEEAVVMLLGISKVIAGEDVDVPGAFIGTGADGRAEVLVEGTDITKYLVGTTIEGGSADGEVMTAVINCAVPQTASAVA